jgi:flagellin-like hook-associated protein FlgL
MAINSIGPSTSPIIQALIDMRAQFDDLQRQLSTGQKSATYAGLGPDRGLTVGLNAQVSALSAYDNSIDNVMTRINLAQNALGAISDVGNAMRSAIAQGSGSAGGTSAAQLSAQSSLQQLLGLLNTQAGDRYLFSGRATDQPAVETYDHIMNGDGARAGFSQVVSERSQADLGADGLGRLVIGAPTASSVSVAEDAVSPFGFKLASVSSSLSNATVSGPSGSPATMSVDFTGAPSEGDNLTLRLNLPDGTSENLTLTATSKSPAGTNQFSIGATPAATAANLSAALTTALKALAGSSLKAASAVTASNDFFSADAGNPPQRVNGPPFDTATSLVAGTAANTVIWYTGEAGAGSARSTATARIDSSLVVSYGMRANEQGIRNLVQNAATLAAVPISSTDPNGANLAAALDQRLSLSLAGSPGDQTVSDIEADLAGVQTSMSAMKSTHQQTSATLGDFLQQIQGVSNEEVGSELLALQTRMQASMQTTAMLSQISLVNYLK